METKTFHFRRLLALLLAFVMLFTATACGETPSTPTDPDVGGEVEDTIFNNDIVASTGKDPVLKETVRDLKGKTIKFATFWQDWDGTNRGIESIQQQEMNAAAIKSIEEDYNCKIEIVLMSSKTYLSDIATARSAGIVYANIFQLQKEMSPLYRSNSVADLSRVESVGLTTNEWNPAMTAMTTYKGKVYGLGVNQNRLMYDVIFFNKTMAEKYNLGDFYQMVRDGEWTHDKFLELNEKVNKASNRKVFGTVGCYTCSLKDLIYSNQTLPIVSQDGRVMFTGTGNDNLKMLNFIQEFAKNGYYYNTAMNMYDHRADTVTASESAFEQGKSLFYITSAWMASNFSKKMKDEYGVLPLPKGPDADSYVNLITNSRYMSLFDGDPDIEDSGAIMVALINRTNMKVADWEDSQLSMLCDEDSLEMLQKIQQSPVVITGDQYMEDPTDGAANNYDMDYWTNAINDILRGSKTPKQAMDEIANPVQALLDDAFND